MQCNNKYVKRSRISETKFRDIIRYFSLDLEASKISILTRISRNTINKYLYKVRERIADYCCSESQLSEIIEVDESYFGAKRIRGKRGRGASGKVKVFGLLKRGDRVYTQIVSNCSRKTLQTIIKERININSEIHSDGWRAYNGLVDLGYKKHYRVYHSNNEFANKNNHINGIESFWAFAKVRLMKFRGLSKQTFYLHLKESEFRFNYRDRNMYKILLKIFRNKPLKLS